MRTKPSLIHVKVRKNAPLLEIKGHGSIFMKSWGFTQTRGYTVMLHLRVCHIELQTMRQGGLTL